jgi:hypothetical protein
MTLIWSRTKPLLVNGGKKFFFNVPPALVVVMLLSSPLEPDIKKTQDPTLNDAFLWLQKCAQIPLCGDLFQRQTTLN